MKRDYLNHTNSQNRIGKQKNVEENIDSSGGRKRKTGGKMQRIEEMQNNNQELIRDKVLNLKLS